MPLWPAPITMPSYSRIFAITSDLKLFERFERLERLQRRVVQIVQVVQAVRYVRAPITRDHALSPATRCTPSPQSPRRLDASPLRLDTNPRSACGSPRFARWGASR